MNQVDPIYELLARAKTIAVVGLSGSPMRPSHGVSAYMQAAGYKISLQSGVTSGRRRQRRNAAPLRRAPDSEIHKAIAEAYDSEETAGAKPSNLKQIAAPVKAILRKRGYEASGNRIQELAGDTRHVGRRRKRGVTVASEKRGQ